MSTATALFSMCSWFIHEHIGGVALTKSSREIMEILEAFDLTRWRLVGGGAGWVRREDGRSVCAGPRSRG
jgi:hypothetical protein